MPSNKKDAHQRVIEKQASKQRGNDSALSEYHREQEAIKKRTAELRALRLAHEAKHGHRKVPPARRGAQSATKETLTDWVEEQKKFGRDT